jgi:hypothetical protein
MSMTRETRRERLRRLAELPDAQVRIKWGLIASIALGIVCAMGTALMFTWMLGMFVDSL